MGGLLRGLHLGWRRLRRRRAVTAVSVGMLALAMGANVAMFSLFSGLLWHTLPYPDAASLAWLAPASLRAGQAEVEGGGGFSPPDFVDYRAQSHAFGYLAAYYPNVATLVGQGEPQHVSYTNVSGGFFETLGVKPQLGRGIEREDEQSPLPQVAVLSDGLWRERYGADPKVLGRSLDLDNRMFTIVGVMPAGFAFPAGSRMWAPESFHSVGSRYRDFHFLEVIGRLRRGVGLTAAAREMDNIARGLAARYPDSDSGQGVEVRGLSEEIAGPFRAALWMMMLAAVLVLGIACANVANLLLADAAGRGREMALRRALGAGRGQLAGQMVGEGLVLAGWGGGLGWLLAAVLMPVLRGLRPPGLPQLGDIHLDGTVLAFTALATAGTGLWFGLAPAWDLRPQAGTNLHRAASTPGSRSRLQGMVARAEVATTVVLLVGAGLLLHSLRRLERVNPGFHAENVLTFRTSLLFNDQDELHAGADFFRRLDLRLPTVPGVEAAGLVSQLPLSGPQSQIHFYVAGSAQGAGLREVERPQAGLARVLPGYFAALEIPVRGRGFNQDDRGGGERVVIVSESLARALFGGGDAVGRSLVWGVKPLVTGRIVGVAGDVRQESLAGAPGWEIYMPYLQSPVGDMSAVVRTRGNPWRLVPTLGQVVGELNPQIPMYEVSTLEQQLAAGAAPERYRAGLLVAMALVALLLAAAGVYSVLAHRVAQRQREIGVRMTLGASPRQVRRMVLAQSLRLMLGGVAAGLVAAWGLARGLEHGLADLKIGDAATWLAAPAILLAVGMVASYWPARQATRVDPVVALRE